MNKEDYSKYYIQGSDHYLIPKDEFIELFQEMANWKEETQNLAKKYNKALQLLTNCNLPCEIDEFNIKEENIDYCLQNCSVDEAIFIKCWDRYIEQELKEVE